MNDELIEDLVKEVAAFDKSVANVGETVKYIKDKLLQYQKISDTESNLVPIYVFKNAFETRLGEAVEIVGSGLYSGIELYSHLTVDDAIKRVSRS